MNNPETPLGTALKTALSDSVASEVQKLESKATPLTKVSAPATKTSAVAVKAAPAVAKAAPAKTLVAVKTVATTATKSAPQLDVGSVIAKAATGATEKAKTPDVTFPVHLVKADRTDSGDARVANPEPDRFTLEIFGTGCLTCRALVDDAELDPLEKLPECHFARGFSLCPAKHVTIRAIGEQRVAARKLIKARDSGDVVKFTRLLSDLSNRDAAFQAEVLKTAGITFGPSNSLADQAEV